MNNTLTGLGLALVLALLAALIGPWFVNWTAYRDDFARQASALVGAPVTVAGAVDARLLPTPYVRFRNIASGAGATRLAVDEVEIELAIAPLLRGEFKAERVRLVRPKLGVEAAADGTVRTAFSAGRKATPGRVSFDRAEIIDGEIALEAPWGASKFTRISGLAEAGSLAGPYKFEGSAEADSRRLDLRLATSRADASGALKIKALAAEAGRRTTFETDGALKLGTKPGFDGRVAIVRAPRREPATPVNEPWSVGGATKLEAGRLTVEGLDLVYGPDDRAVRLTGAGGLSFGELPRLELRLETRQIDFDRLLGDGRPRTPAGVLKEIASRLPVGLVMPANGSLALDARGLVVAGDVLRDLRLELEAENGAWRVRRGWATLPGEARASLSGAVTFPGGEPSFAGPVDFDAADLPGLRRWLAGGRVDGASIVRRLAIKGDVAARLGSITVEKAELATDGARSTGRLAWIAASEGARARLQAALVSDRLDLDALGLGRVIGDALSARDLDAFVALDAKTLVVWGMAMRDVSVDGALDRSGLDLKRFEIRDAGGARISGLGRLVQEPAGLAGKLGFKVVGRTLDPLLAIARANGVPEPAVEALETRAGALAPVDLQVDVVADGGARLVSIVGAAAGGRMEARLNAPELSLDADSELELQIASPDGRKLAALAGFSISPLDAAKGGEIALQLKGAPARGMRGDGRFSALGLSATGQGAVALAPVVGLSAQGEARLETKDLGALAAAIGRATPLSGSATPATLAARIALDADGVRLEDLQGDVAGRAFSGRATAPSDPGRPIEGRLTFEELPAQAIAALAVSHEALAGAGDGSAWPTAAFGPSPVRGLLGRFDVTTAKLPIAGSQVATDARFRLAVKRDGVAVEDLSAKLDQGRVWGSVAVSRSGDDATASLNLTLGNAAAEQMLGLDRRSSPLLGAVDLKVEAQGTGRTLAGLVGSMTGAGQLSLSDATIRRLDPSAIDRVEPQIEEELLLDAPKVAVALAKDLDAADMRLKRAAASFTISGGVVRTGGIDATTETARIGGGAALDLRRLSLDADLTLQPVRPDAPQIGVAFEGPLAAPVRRVDVTAFTGWLSIRAVERETRRIEAMEADARERARLARERQEEERRVQEIERKRAEAEKAKADAERRRAEAERKKREAAAGALIDALPRPTTPSPLSSGLDLSTPSETTRSGAPSAPPAGVFAPQGAQSRPAGRAAPETLLPAPQSILPPAAATQR